MFARFKIDKTVIARNLPSAKVDEWEKKENTVKGKLETIIKGDKGIIDGNKLMNWCFPLDLDEDYPIFISHSHEDIKEARALAEYIKDKHGLNCFIDSLVWENAYKVLGKIDEDYCKNEGKNTFDYSKRNYTTSHVYAMLSLSLLEMIQKTECCILIGNGDTINLNDVREGKTISPWVFEEITYMNNLPIVPPRGLHISERTRNSMRFFSDRGREELFEANEFKAQYATNTNNFIELTLSDLRRVDINNPNHKLKTEWLNYLYRKNDLIVKNEYLEEFNRLIRS